MDTSASDGRAEMPAAYRVYLAHVVEGRSIRSLARQSGCHASTILRQVRRCEQRRDDPLVETALRRLGPPEGPQTQRQRGQEPRDMTTDTTTSTAKFEAEALRVLRRMAEPRACLAVAEGMETAVIVRENDDGAALRTGTADRALAEALALREWIATGTPGRAARLARYRITASGRSALKEMLARQEGARTAASLRDPRADAPTRTVTAESPLAMLARRRDRDGSPFLTPAAVRAGERLREDFEIAAMGPVPAGGWQALLGTTPEGDPDARGCDGARARLWLALADLGPGLGDVALRVCCQLEGLETLEKRMGWAARSGKIVLRIALDRLARHMEAGAAQGALIG